MTPKKIIELTHSTGDIAFAVDNGGEVVAWNRAAVEAFAIQEDDAIGRSCGDLLQGVDECGPVCSDNCTMRQAVMQQRPVRNIDLQAVTPFGRRWFNVSMLIFSDAGSPNIYALYVARSIDVRKRLEVLMRDFVHDESSTDAGTWTVNRAAVMNAALSVREVEVVRMLAQGHTTEEIARSLGISRATVNNHTQHVMSKLDAHTRLEAVRKAVYAGII